MRTVDTRRGKFRKSVSLFGNDSEGLWRVKKWKVELVVEYGKKQIVFRNK